MPDGIQPVWDEAERLAALRAYGVLDAPLSAKFDDFVQIAAQVCETPIAVVNFIDEGRQWFAAEIGLGIPESPLDISICARAILQPDTFVIPDLAKDARFDCNPLVTGEPGLRFYGGALLETSTPLPLGTMCVLDYKPRPEGLTARQHFTLRALARQVMTQLELQRVVAEKELLVLEAHHRVKNSLQMLQSLLTLQARTTAHKEVAQELRESAARIHAFGAMHEQLYRVGDGLRVDVAAYLRGLLEGQAGAFASMLDGRGIAFQAPDGATWPSSDAPAVGLIVMELVTNALKHGRGMVTVTLNQSRDEMTLAVADEGNQLREDYRPLSGKGLGMRVITGLLRARRGRLEVDRTREHTRLVATLSGSQARR